ncbi:MAG: hypothetical protein Q4F74_00890 [Synergistaceae bacterium]|nr:hypothetical protein [Synergistaceae bacterium]
MKKNTAFLFAALAAMAMISCASVSASERVTAKEVGVQLSDLLRPEAMRVVINDDSAWVTATGSSLDGVRVESMKLRAKLKNSGRKATPTDKTGLAALIESSEGELILLERDVNTYFKGHGGVKGFSDLTFDFASTGFTAQSSFSADFLNGLNVPLTATGKLGLRSDGVYLQDTNISLAGLIQVGSASSFIVDRINPLLSFKSLPFPVTFRTLTMDSDKVSLTGSPTPILAGDVWTK